MNFIQRAGFCPEKVAGRESMCVRLSGRAPGVIMSFARPSLREGPHVLFTLVPCDFSSRTGTIQFSKHFPRADADRAIGSGQRWQRIRGGIHYVAGFSGDAGCVSEDLRAEYMRVHSWTTRRAGHALAMPACDRCQDRPQWQAIAVGDVLGRRDAGPGHGYRGGRRGRRVRRRDHQFEDFSGYAWSVADIAGERIVQRIHHQAEAGRQRAAVFDLPSGWAGERPGFGCIGRRVRSRVGVGHDVPDHRRRCAIDPLRGESGCLRAKTKRGGHRSYLFHAARRHLRGCRQRAGSGRRRECLCRGIHRVGPAVRGPGGQRLRPVSYHDGRIECHHRRSGHVRK